MSLGQDWRDERQHGGTFLCEIYNQNEGEPRSLLSETPSSMERGSSDRGFLFYFAFLLLLPVLPGFLPPFSFGSVCQATTCIQPLGWSWLEEHCPCAVGTEAVHPTPTHIPEKARGTTVWHGLGLVSPSSQMVCFRPVGSLLLLAVSSTYIFLLPLSLSPQTLIILKGWGKRTSKDKHFFSPIIFRKCK